MNDTEKLYEIKDQLYEMLENYLTYSNNDFEVRIERMIDMIKSASTPCYHKAMYEDCLKQLCAIKRQYYQLLVENRELRSKMRQYDYSKESLSYAIESIEETYTHLDSFKARLNEIKERM